MVMTGLFPKNLPGGRCLEGLLILLHTHVNMSNSLEDDAVLVQELEQALLESQARPPLEPREISVLAWTCPIQKNFKHTIKK